MLPGLRRAGVEGQIGEERLETRGIDACYWSIAISKTKLTEQLDVQRLHLCGSPPRPTPFSVVGIIDNSHVSVHLAKQIIAGSKLGQGLVEKPSQCICLFKTVSWPGWNRGSQTRLAECCLLMRQIWQHATTFDEVNGAKFAVSPAVMLKSRIAMLVPTLASRCVGEYKDSSSGTRKQGKAAL